MTISTVPFCTASSTQAWYDFAGGEDAEGNLLSVISATYFTSISPAP
jgi:hypothetical protein